MQMEKYIMIGSQLLDWSEKHMRRKDQSTGRLKSLLRCLPATFLKKVNQKHLTNDGRKKFPL